MSVLSLCVSSCHRLVLLHHSFSLADQLIIVVMFKIAVLIYSGVNVCVSARAFFLCARENMQEHVCRCVSRCLCVHTCRRLSCFRLVHDSFLSTPYLHLIYFLLNLSSDLRASLVGTGVPAVNDAADNNRIYTKIHPYCPTHVDLIVSP